MAGPVPEALRAGLRLAAAETTSAATAVTQSLFEACGSAAVYANAQLEGCMRDLAVIGRHALLAAPALWTAWRRIAGRGQAEVRALGYRVAGAALSVTAAIALAHALHERIAALCQA